MFHCVCQLLGRPSSSPDGSRLIFATGISRTSTVTVIRPDGTDRRTIHLTVRGICCPTWQPVPTGATITPPRSPPPFADGDPCPPTSDPDVPKGAGCLTVARGDFDGDGLTDRFVVYAYPLDAHWMPLAWHLVWVPGVGGGPREVDVVSGSHEPAPLRALGAVDLNGDGRDDVLVRGAAITARVTDFAAVFLFEDGAWHLAEHANGRTRLVLATGGTGMTGVGGRCAGSGSSRRLILDEILVRGDTAETTERWYRWKGYRVRLDHVQTGKVRGGSQFWQFRCDGVAF